MLLDIGLAERFYRDDWVLEKALRMLLKQVYIEAMH